MLQIISSTGLAYWGGRLGENIRKYDFEDNTILGIRPFHWSWLWLISAPYIQGVASAVIRWIVMDNWSDLDLISLIPVFLSFIVVMAYLYPMSVMYAIPSGEILSEKHAIIKVLAFIGFYIGGLLLGSGTDFICTKLINVIF